MKSKVFFTHEDFFANVFHYLNCWPRSTGNSNSGSVEQVVNIVLFFILLDFSRYLVFLLMLGY